MSKPRLMTPGPTEVPAEALAKLARQVTHHRTDDFRRLFAEVLDGLKYVFQTEHDVVVLASSGTGAMEAAVVNVVARGEKAIVLASGKFSQRWADICDAFGVQAIRHEIPWGDPFDAEDVARLLREHPDAQAVYATLSETSTGVAHDIEAIGRAVRPTDALLVVDAISGAGVVPCRTDAWGIDVLVVGAQKALMGVPGTSMLAVSPAAWSRIESLERQAFYFDLVKYRKSLAKYDTPFTPPKSLLAALGESLRVPRALGIEEVWARGRLLARATRQGLSALGLSLVAKRPSEGLTAAYLPADVDAGRFLARLEERFGVKLAGGQGPLAGRIFRIAHMGILDELDILSALGAIELILTEMGHAVELGSGVAAASRVLAEAASPSADASSPSP